MRNVPKGRVGWAAVKREELKISPEAVGLPSNSLPYHEANPSCLKAPSAWFESDWASAPGVARRTAIQQANAKIVMRFIPSIIGIFPQ
jgi:hypothetical protein